MLRRFLRKPNIDLSRCHIVQNILEQHASIKGIYEHIMLVNCYANLHHEKGKKALVTVCLKIFNDRKKRALKWA